LELPRSWVDSSYKLQIAIANLATRGYSPNFFLKMKEKRIACLTYHKYPGDDWPEDEFFPTKVRLASGEETTIRLAERAISAISCG